MYQFRPSKSTIHWLLFFVLFGTVSAPIFVLSQTVDPNVTIDEINKQIVAKQAQVKQIEASIDDYKKKINQKHLEKVSLSNQIAILDNRAAQVALDIEATKTKLDTITLQIESLQIEIVAKQKVLEKQKKIVGELIRAVFQQGGKSYVEILATYDSFSDFYNQMQYVEKIDRELGKSVRELRLVKEDLESKKKDTEDRKKSYQELSDRLAGQRQDLLEQGVAKQDLLTKTHASEATYQTLLKSLRQQYQAMESDIAVAEQEVRRRLDAQHKLPSEPANTRGLFSWPVSSRYITTDFHDSGYPFRRIMEHSGLDIRASQGTPVRAVASGYIARAKRCTVSSCYAYVMIIHDNGISTLYGHLSQIVAQEDQYVARGDTIGLSGGMPGTVGAGPFVTGPHLHFEVRQDGIPVNPVPFMMQ